MIEPTFCNLTDFVKFVMTDVPGCPVAAVKEKLLKAAIEYCEKSNVWRYEHVPMELIIDEPEYELEPPNNTTKICSILSIATDQSPPDLRATSIEWLDANYHNWREETANRPSYYFSPHPRWYRLVPIPIETVEGVVFPLVALKPTHDATQVWDELFENVAHREAIVAKAQSELLMMPQKTWTNPQLAMVRQATYNMQLGRAKVDARKGYTKRTMRVSDQEFGFAGSDS